MVFYLITATVARQGGYFFLRFKYSSNAITAVAVAIIKEAKRLGTCRPPRRCSIRSGSVVYLGILGMPAMRGARDEQAGARAAGRPGMAMTALCKRAGAAGAGRAAHEGRTGGRNAIGRH
jgi:hypothetical protein